MSEIIEVDVAPDNVRLYIRVSRACNPWITRTGRVMTHRILKATLYFLLVSFLTACGSHDPATVQVFHYGLNLPASVAQRDAPVPVVTPPPLRQAVARTPLPEAKPLPQKEQKKHPVQQASLATRKMPPASSKGFIKPVDGRILSTFGPKKDTLHNDGINILAESGTPVRNAKSGTVIYAGDEIESFGNLVLVRHEDDFITAYAHLSDIQVTQGDKLSQGDILGHVGSTGNVKTPQLHFQIRRGTRTVNPELYL